MRGLPEPKKDLNRPFPESAHVLSDGIEMGLDCMRNGNGLITMADEAEAEECNPSREFNPRIENVPNEKKDTPQLMKAVNKPRMRMVSPVDGTILEETQQNMPENEPRPSLSPSLPRTLTEGDGSSPSLTMASCSPQQGSPPADGLLLLEYAVGGTPSSGHVEPPSSHVVVVGAPGRGPQGGVKKKEKAKTSPFSKCLRLLESAKLLEFIEACTRLQLDDKEIDQSGNSLLHHACIHGNKETVKYLLQAEMCDVNGRNQEGNTPLHYCYGHNQRHLIEMIQAWGADPRVTNRYGIMAKGGHQKPELDAQGAYVGQKQGALYQLPLNIWAKPVSSPTYTKRGFKKVRKQKRRRSIERGLNADRPALPPLSEAPLLVTKSPVIRTVESRNILSPMKPKKESPSKPSEAVSPAPSIERGLLGGGTLKPLQSALLNSTLGKRTDELIGKDAKFRASETMLGHPSSHTKVTKPTAPAMGRPVLANLTNAEKIGWLEGLPRKLTMTYALCHVGL